MDTASAEEESMNVPHQPEVDYDLMRLGYPTFTVRRSWTDEDLLNATKAIVEDGMPLCQASKRFKIPRTTLAAKIGDRRPPRTRKNEDRKLITRYMWSESDMEKALEAVQTGTASISDAAKQFGVPASSLNARFRGRAPRDLKGEMSRLSLKQESLLADWASAQCQLGCPPTKDDVFNLAAKVLKQQGADKTLGKQWVGHWMKRNPHLEILDWAEKEREREKAIEREAKKQKTTSAAAFAEVRFEVVDE